MAAIKHPHPINRSAALFDTVEPFDIRFRLKEGKWSMVVKHKLVTSSGEESKETFEATGPVTLTEIHKLDILIKKIINKQ